MKIQSFTHGIVDTDKLPDLQAEIVEESERFKAFIRARGGEEFIWMKIPGRMTWASIHLDTIPSMLGVVNALDVGIRTISDDTLGVALLPVKIIEAVKQWSSGAPPESGNPS